MTTRSDPPHRDAPLDPDDFEAIVAAALKVDPEGIVGQKAKPQSDEPESG